MLHIWSQFWFGYASTLFSMSSTIGSRKRKSSFKIRENGEQPKKKKKSAKKTTGIQKETPCSTSHTTSPSIAPSGPRSHSVEVEEIEDEDSDVGARGPRPRDGSNILELEDESQNEEPPKAEEDAEKQLRKLHSFINMAMHDKHLAERLKKVWTSPVYAFYKATPEIEDTGDLRFHIFECIAPHCKGRGKNGRHIRRNLTTSDATSTSNLRKHAEACWGKEALDAARNASSVNEARKVLMTHTPRDGSITTAFARIQGKGKITFSTRPPTIAEIRADHVRWMAESKRAFNLVHDNGYHRVMKNGRPSHYIPSRQTIARDLLKVFSHSRERISKLLKVCLIRCARLLLFDLQFFRNTREI
jgi:hypothetical protein